MRVPPQHLDFQMQQVRNATQRVNGFSKTLMLYGTALLSTFGVGMAVSVSYGAISQTSTASSSVNPAIPTEVLLPGEIVLNNDDRLVDVRISYAVPQEVIVAAADLSKDCNELVVPEVTPTLSALSESISEADAALDVFSKDVSTVVIKDVSLRDARLLQTGKMSEESLKYLYPDAQIEVLPLSEIIAEVEEESVNLETQIPPIMDIANLNDAEFVESSAAQPEKIEVSVVRTPTAAEKEIFGSVAAASQSVKAARENLSETDRILIGDVDDLSVLSDEELDTVNEVRPSDAVTAEYLRRISERGSGLLDYGNGQVDESELVALSWNKNFLMQKDAAKMFELLNRDFKAESGYDLKLTSAYRPLRDQYRVKAQSPGMTAVPGTSNHGYGLAVDIGVADRSFVSYDSFEHQWLLENGHKYGWLHPYWAGRGQSRPEPWHFEFGTFYGSEYAEEFNNEKLPEFRIKWLSPNSGLIG